MYNKNNSITGFLLLELIVSMAVASGMFMGMFITYQKSNQLVNIVDDIAERSRSFAVARYQIERDLSGAYIPESFLRQLKNKKAQTGQEVSQEKPHDKQDEKDEKKRALTHIFYGTKKITEKNMVDFLTFITNNPLNVYKDDAQKNAQPLHARVMYRLVEEKNIKKSQKDRKTYTLLRQESHELSYEPFESDIKSTQKKIKEYEILTGIQECTVEYMVHVEQDKKAQEKAQEKKELNKKEVNKIIFMTYDDWTFELKKQEKKEEQERYDTGKIRKIPELVLVKMRLWNNARTRVTSMEFIVPIIADVDPKVTPNNRPALAPAPAKNNANLAPVQPTVQMGYNNEYRRSLPPRRVQTARNFRHI